MTKLGSFQEFVLVLKICEPKILHYFEVFKDKKTEKSMLSDNFKGRKRIW